ncbi:MAG: SRPBCC domain-containing protein [Candidatus Hydrogenedentes bacterium]|nr:SRPBCC domain-containing protein [Candidatus Hydrogenedentota bacterium]
MSNLITEPASRVLLITRVLDAPRELVFKVWTQPQHLAQWWGPKNFTTPDCNIDVRPGGFYRIHIRSGEGKDYWMQGVYREVVEPERLVFTFSWDTPEGKRGHETIVTVLFEDANGKTKFTFHQAVFESDSSRNDHNTGWSECFDRLAAYVAR